MSAKIRALHLFYQYLNITENWTFRMIDNLPDTDVVVGSKQYLKNNFYRTKFSYIEFPVRFIEDQTDRFSVRIFNYLANNALELYPWYLSKMVGKVDVIHSHFSFVGWEYRKLARKLNVPHVVSFYGADYERLPYAQPEWHHRYRILFKEADLFLCEGHHGAQTLERIGCPPEKIKLSRINVNVDEIPFCLREKKAGELKLVQIASHRQKKGHVYTVRAFMEALKECPNMTLTLVGGDPEGIKKKLHEMLSGSTAESRVSFVDQIDYYQLYEFMRSYDVFIHPSCYSSDKDCEGGAPIVLLDAQGTGMPVISTTHCDIPEEVLHEKTGFLTREKDITALSESIAKFYFMGGDEYRQFAQAARRHVDEHFNSKRNAVDLVQLYHNLISLKNSRNKCVGN